MNSVIFQVSATFAASLVTSPALGAYLASIYSDNFVIWLASAIALLDVLFILVVVPESLPEKVRPSSWGSPISWDKVDPFMVSWITVQFKFSNRPEEASIDLDQLPQNVVSNQGVHCLPFIWQFFKCTNQ